MISMNQKEITANNINMVLLVAKMCISKVKYGIARSPMVVFETEMAVREKISQLTHLSTFLYVIYYSIIRIL